MSPSWSDVDFRERTVRIERDIDFASGDVGALKTPSSLRTIPLPDDLFDALNAVRGVGDTYILQSPESASFLCDSTFRRRWLRLTCAMYQRDNTISHEETKSSINARKKYDKLSSDAKAKGKSFDAPPPVREYQSTLSPHYFRHHFASLCYDAGIDVMTTHKWLGHSDPNTTLTIYTHLSKQREDKNTAAMNAAFTKKVAKRLPVDK
ncbi:tyrosine-type recombinase/integrase [Christensenellaceae bacterium OttesenSCG-928-L17]|nr:tyrosine-type recombinase/integrase [Christensenellaceae bacterium OttesenSCG-928-L17]